MNRASRPAVFLDRDGVLIQDTGLITRTSDIRVIPGVPHALARLSEGGFLLIIVSNQAAVARGILSEEDVLVLQEEVTRMLVGDAAPRIDGFYFCPHHPNATLPSYRVACECRKPRPGLLLRAARELNISLSESFMVGDRVTDIIAGKSAGCTTILVESGAHQELPIETVDSVDASIKANFRCASLSEAASWILRTT